MIRCLAFGAALLALVAGCAAPSTLPAAQVAPVAAEAPPIAAPVEVRIPSLRVTDNLIPVGMAALEDGKLLPIDAVGWYELSPKPGEDGRAVLAGHVNWRSKPGAPLVAGAFEHLPQMKVGDTVTTKAADGIETTWVTYRAAQVKKADYTATTVPMVFGPTTYPRELALVTCSGQLVGRSYDSNTIVLLRAL